MNSSGSAMKENETYVNSLKGKLSDLNSAWQQLAKDSINSDFVKMLLSAVTGFVKLVDAVGGLTALTPAVISLIAALEFKRIASGASKLGIVLKGVKEYLGILSSLSKETGKSMISVFLETRTSAEMLRLSLVGIGTALSVAFMAINVAQGIYQKKAQAASDVSQALQDKYTEEANELEELGNTYSELISKKSLSADEDNKLSQAIDTLNSKYGMNIDATDKDTESIENNTEAIRDNAKAKKEAAAIEKRESVLSEDSLGDKIFGSGFTVESMKNALKKPIKSAFEEGYEEFRLNLSKQGVRYEDVINPSSPPAQTIGASTIAGYQENLQREITLREQVTDRTKEQEKALQTIRDEYNKVNKIVTTGKEAYSGILELYKQGIPITNSDALALYNLGEITRDQVSYVNDYNNASEEEKNKLAEKTVKTESNTQALDENQKKIQEVATNTENLNKEIDEIQKAYDALHSAVDEYNSNGYLTIDTLQSLLSLSPEYLANLSMQNGQLQVNNMSLEDQVNALKYNAIAQLEAAKAADLNALSQGKMENVSAGAKQAIAGIGNTAVQTGAQVLSSAASFENFASRVLGAVNKLKAAAGQSFLGKWTENAKSKEQKAVENYYNNLEDTIKNLKVDTTHIGTSGKSGGRKSGGGKSSGGKSGKSASETYKAEVDALYAYNNALDIAKDRVDALNDALKNTDNYEEQEKYIRQLIDALNDQIAKTNDLKNAQTNQINDYINQLRQQGFSIDYNASKNELYINNMQHLADFTGDSAKNVEKIIKKIQELNKDNRSLDGSIRDLTKSTKDYYDKLADLPEEKLKKFKELLKDFQQSQLDQVQNQITDLQYAMEQDVRLKALEEQIEALENQNDELDKQKELEEKLLAVEEAKEKLANQRKQKNIQIFRENQG